MLAIVNLHVNLFLEYGRHLVGRRTRAHALAIHAASQDDHANKMITGDNNAPSPE